PEYVVSRLTTLLEQRKRTLSGARVHVLGVTYKRDVNDVRESPALEIMTLLADRGAQISYSDPFVSSLMIAGRLLNSKPLTDAVLGSADVAVIVTNHSQFDYGFIARTAPMVFDLRNATQGVSGNQIFRL